MGAMTLPLVRTTSPPKRIITTMMGASQYFFRARMNAQSSTISDIDAPLADRRCLGISADLGPANNLQPLGKYQPEIARSTRWAGKIASTGTARGQQRLQRSLAARTVLAVRRVFGEWGQFRQLLSDAGTTLFALRRSHSCGDLIRQEFGQHRFSQLVEVTGAVDVDGVGDVVKNGRCQNDAARF